MNKKQMASELKRARLLIKFANAFGESVSAIQIGRDGINTYKIKCTPDAMQEAINLCLFEADKINKSLPGKPKSIYTPSSQAYKIVWDYVHGPKKRGMKKSAIADLASVEDKKYSSSEKIFTSIQNQISKDIAAQKSILRFRDWLNRKTSK